MLFNLRPIKKHYGAYIDCNNITELSPDDYMKIKEYLSIYGLLIFNHQQMDDEALINFSRKIGNGKLEEPARNISLAENRRYIAYLTNLNDSDGEPLGFPGSKTDYWHSDQEFRINPASVSILYGVVTQCEGGNTSFASTSIDIFNFSNENANKKMPDLNPFWSTRKPATSHDNVPHITVAHPVIIKNKKTEKEYVYVSENTIEFLEDDNPVIYSEMLKASILGKILSEENIYSHSWSGGDLILYDNSQLLHRRECFSGNRFIKALKIYPDNDYQPKIAGKEIEEVHYAYCERK
ncbi:MAG: TauD/TfdA family dioxygenase [Enterobacteriaceae bacterium]|jgi:taurine dioxygenase|nr:TauD/TfdA family dioxygenase [Enterobacteriaceae bacterium]